MSVPQRPRLRGLEIFPLGESSEQFVLRDPSGAADAVVLPLGGAILASFMDGRRSLGDLQEAFQQQTGQTVSLVEVQRLVEQLDERYFLDSDRFRAYWQKHVQSYLDHPVRPAAHAGGAYEGEPEKLRAQLARLFTCSAGPGAPGATPATNGHGQLCGVLSPHIDLHRGGPTFAWAYKKIVERSDADLFLIFGTAHTAMRNLFSVSRKDFATPLGTVETDRTFIDSLAAHLDRRAGEGASQKLFEDEIAHRHEHSIEFQTVFLQYLLGGQRPFRIVPILTGSLHAFFGDSRLPMEDAAVSAFVEALRDAVADYSGKICYISGGDLAHIGRRFGDRELLSAGRLDELRQDDHALLARACAADADGFFAHVARRSDPHRICGLSPTYTMLQTMQPTRGELLRYDQAVETDATSCVSFASLAFYRDK